MYTGTLYNIQYTMYTGTIVYTVQYINKLKKGHVAVWQYNTLDKSLPCSVISVGQYNKPDKSLPCISVGQYNKQDKS